MVAAAMIAVTPAVAAAATSTLNPGQTLTSGQELVSPDGHYDLVMQSDGNLVLYIAGGRYLWQSNTAGNPGAYAVMQTNGNLAVYSSSNQVLWSTNTSTAPCAYLSLQIDGNLALYGASGAVWSTGTVNDTLAPGDKLTAGQEIIAANEQYTLNMQTDGNLVLYHSGAGALWNSGTEGNPGADAIMQTDGNLVVYSSAGTALWNSGTYGHPGAQVYVQADGNLVIYDAGPAIWQSGTYQHAIRQAAARGAASSGSNCGVPVPPTPTTPTQVVDVPVIVYVPAPRAPHHVKVKLTMSWTWNLGRTRLYRVVAGRLPRHAAITVTCRGRGCPGNARVASVHIRRLLKALAGRSYRAGDRIYITIRVPGQVSERVELRIRYGMKPAVKLL
jgi:hypothetical protein